MLVPNLLFLGMHDVGKLSQISDLTFIIKGKILMEIIKSLVTKIEELNEIKSELMSSAHSSFKDLLTEALINYKQIASTEDEIDKNKKDNKIQLKPAEELIKIYPYQFSFDKYRNKLSQLHEIIGENVILEIHRFYKNLEFLQNLSKELLVGFNKNSKLDKSEERNLLRLNINSDLDGKFKVKYKDYIELEKRARAIGSSLITQLSSIGKSQPSMLLVRNEYEYLIEDTKKIRFIYRKLFNTVNNKIDGCNTSIEYNYRAKELEFIGYFDIDEKSDFDMRFGNKIKDKITGEPLFPFFNVKPVDTEPGFNDYNFGVNCNTDLDINDFYWLEIHAKIKNVVEVKGGEYFTKLNMYFGEKSSNIINVKIPNQKEGIFRKYITEITKAIPSPNLTFDDSFYKVFVWNLDNIYPNQRFRIDLYFKRRIDNTPLIKSLLWVIIGVGMTLLATYYGIFFP